MSRGSIKIGNKFVGDGHPCFVVAEIGINHNGDLETAKKLVRMAYNSGCDAVKFQKRTVDAVYSAEELAAPRVSVFGTTNGDQKRGLELSLEAYDAIDVLCKELGMMWFASCWDTGSVDDILCNFFSPCFKVASASLTDMRLLRKLKDLDVPLLVSTGMSTLQEIDDAVALLGDHPFMLYHCTSTYPCKNEEINLRAIAMLKARYNVPVGYSGHEKGIMPSVMAVAMGACSVERHITLDRTLWGSDQAASLEPEGLERMIRDIRNVPLVLGDGQKVVYPSEVPVRAKLRKN